MSNPAKKIYLVDALDRKIAYLNADPIMISDMGRPGASGWTAEDVARALGDNLGIQIEPLDLREVQGVRGWDELQHHMNDYFAQSQKDAQQQSDVFEKPMALITMSGGVWRDTGIAGDVDVEVFDFDDYNDDPSAFKSVLPARFKGLAEDLKLPADVVAQDDEEESLQPSP